MKKNANPRNQIILLLFCPLANSIIFTILPVDQKINLVSPHAEQNQKSLIKIRFKYSGWVLKYLRVKELVINQNYPTEKMKISSQQLISLEKVKKKTLGNRKYAFFLAICRDFLALLNPSVQFKYHEEFLTKNIMHTCVFQGKDKFVHSWNNARN